MKLCGVSGFFLSFHLVSYLIYISWKLYIESEWLLFSANSAVFQLYHGENKLILMMMMMMRSALY